MSHRFRRKKTKPIEPGPLKVKSGGIYRENRGNMTASSIPSSIHGFVRETRYESLPPAVRHMAERCLLDLAGTAAAGLATPLSRIIGNHALRAFGAGEGAPRARLLFDGRRASPLGAALAGGMTIDSFDAHYGHVLTKGHAGVAILPGLLALADAAIDA